MCALITALCACACLNSLESYCRSLPDGLGSQDGVHQNSTRSSLDVACFISWARTRPVQISSVSWSPKRPGWTLGRSNASARCPPLPRNDLGNGRNDSGADGSPFAEQIRRVSLKVGALRDRLGCLDPQSAEAGVVRRAAWRARRLLGKFRSRETLRRSGPRSRANPWTMPRRLEGTAVRARWPDIVANHFTHKYDGGGRTSACSDELLMGQWSSFVAPERLDGRSLEIPRF